MDNTPETHPGQTPCGKPFVSAVGAPKHGDARRGKRAEKARREHALPPIEFRRNDLRETINLLAP
jgi:hypothetical protein